MRSAVLLKGAAADGEARRHVRARRCGERGGEQRAAVSASEREKKEQMGRDGFVHHSSASALRQQEREQRQGRRCP